MVTTRASDRNGERRNRRWNRRYLLGGGEGVGELRERRGDGVEAADQHQRVLPEPLRAPGRHRALHQTDQIRASTRQDPAPDRQKEGFGPGSRSWLRRRESSSSTVDAAEATRRRSSRMVSTRVRRPSQNRSSEAGLTARDAAAESIGGGIRGRGTGRGDGGEGRKQSVGWATASFALLCGWIGGWEGFKSGAGSGVGNGRIKVEWGLKV